MANKYSKLSLEKVQSLLDYNPETGVFRWKISTSNCIKVGQIAGNVFTPSKGIHYRQTSLYGKKYSLHRLAWFMYYGKWPEYNIDHINGDGLDNRISNLRDVPQTINGKNCRFSKNNTSGATGVNWYKRDSVWESFVHVNRKKIFLGRFKDFNEAVKARKDAENKYGFTERHGEKL